MRVNCQKCYIRMDNIRDNVSAVSLTPNSTQCHTEVWAISITKNIKYTVPGKSSVIHITPKYTSARQAGVDCHKCIYNHVPSMSVKYMLDKAAQCQTGVDCDKCIYNQVSGMSVIHVTQSFTVPDRSQSCQLCMVTPGWSNSIIYENISKCTFKTILITYTCVNHFRQLLVI